MAVGQKLNLTQSQSLVMTPQLQQAIKLLQLSNVELARYIEQELERNPMLERDDNQSENPMSFTTGGIVAQAEPATVDFTKPTSEQNTSLDKSETSSSDSASRDEQASNASTQDGPDYSEDWSGGNADDIDIGSSPAFESWGNGGSGSFDGEYDFESNLVSKESLRDHITSQINIEFSEAIDRVIALQLMDMVDESGYLQGDLNRLVDTLGCTMDQVDDVLSGMQTFDPAGIFARDLKECLKIQLLDSGRYDAVFAKILDNLLLVGQGDWAKLQRMTELNEDQLKVYLQEIKSLQPKPALEYEAISAQSITPDVLLRPAQAGGWIVELNQANLPRVLVNNSYVSRISKVQMREDDRTFVVDQLQSANWLVKALHQRATTILKVATAIVQVQEDFFSRGVQHMRPLVLREIADRVGIHESTVSRVTNSKFIQTQRGMYELKYFFNAAISGADGENSHSSESVRDMIKKMISAEQKNKILSDDTIVKNLHEQGVEIARRTVAKYRESMRIPSSVQRRREKALT
ncbi:MAG: RNA polymerase factor sigma-54 [Alphaproteobacteria bacterium]